MVDSSRNVSCNNISLRVDQEDSSISIERLKTWTPQNFTSILNNPTPQYSFYEDIKNKIYSGLYDTNSNFEMTDISKDFEKFTDISSPRSSSSGRSSRTSRMSFRELLNESYEDYLNKIKGEFAVYKMNHFRKLKVNNEINSWNDDDLTIYQSCQKIYKSVPGEYFTHLDFKIPKEILEKKKEEIEKYCRELIEKCGDLELEIGKILLHSSKLYNFINCNLEPLYQDLKFVCEKVDHMKHVKSFMKRNLLVNAAKKIKLGLKKKNINTVTNLFTSLQKLKEIVEILKVLAKDQSKYQITQDIIAKGRELLSKFEMYNPKPKIVKSIEEEFTKLCNKSIDKLQNEFTTVLNDELNLLIKFGNEQEPSADISEESMTSFFTREYNFDFSSYNGLTNLARPLFNSLEINSGDLFINNKKLKDILQIIVKSDLEFFSKLRNLLTGKYFDFILEIKDALARAIYKKPSQTMLTEKLQIVTIQDTDKLDFLFLIFLNKIYLLIIDNFSHLKKFLEEVIKDSISEITNLDQKRKEIINDNYFQELNEISLIIKNEIIKLLNSSFARNLSNAMNHSNFDIFIENYERIKQVLEFNWKEDTSKFSSFSKVQSDYIGMYFQNKNNKLKESVECEDWTAVKIIPSSHQNMINFICGLNLSSLANVSPAKILNLFSLNEKFSSPEEETTSTIKIKNVKENIVSFKLVLSTLDVIRVIFDSLKMFLLLPSNDIIICNLVNYLNTFVLLIKAFILDGEAFRKGIIKRLSQAEVSIANSNACIIRNVILCLLKNNSDLSEKDFNELLVNVDKIKHTCRYNMSDMLNSSIKESIDELTKIDFGDYPLYAEEDKRPLSEWVKKYHKFNSAYSSMIDAFEESDISNTMQEILKLFFDKLETAMKILSEKNKLVDPSGQKQFKRDMTAVKKNLKTFKVLGDALGPLQDRVDSITKIVLPKITKKKTTITEDK